MNKNERTSVGHQRFTPESPTSSTFLPARKKRRILLPARLRSPHLSMRMLGDAESLHREISTYSTDIAAVRSCGVQLSLLWPASSQGLLEKIAEQQNLRIKLFTHELLFKRLIDRRVVLAALQMFYQHSSDLYRDWTRDEYAMLAHCCREHALQVERDTTLESLLNLTQNS